MKEFLAKAKPSYCCYGGSCGCHHWGQFAENVRYEVRSINQKKVKGYFEGHKSDHNDALATTNATRI